MVERSSTTAPITPLTIDTESFDEQDIRFTPDELTAYFGSNRAKEPGWGNDAFSAHRASITEPFSAPILLPGIANPNSWASDPNPTPDNLGLYFEGGCVAYWESQPAMCGAHRNTPDSAFDKPFTVEVGSGATPKFFSSVYAIHGGAIAYFTTWNVDNTQRIGRSVRVDEADFGPIEVIQIDGAPEDQASPVVSEDETVLFFMSYPVGSLWMATRQDTTKPFTNAHALEPLVNDLASYANWISPDGCRLYFTRSLDTGAGTQSDVFMASR